MISLRYCTYFTIFYKTPSIKAIILETRVSYAYCYLSCVIIFSIHVQDTIIRHELLGVRSEYLLAWGYLRMKG